MTAGSPLTGPEREVWRRAARRAAVYTWIFLAAAVLVAVAGSAGVAWLLARSGLPFLATWIVLTLLILIIAAGVAVVRALVERGRVGH